MLGIRQASLYYYFSSKEAALELVCLKGVEGFFEAAKAIAAEPPRRFDGTEGPGTSWLTDPDGYRIELVQWPAGHADGMTEADFA